MSWSGAKLWLLVLLATALLGAQLVGDIRWRDRSGGPKTGVAGLVNLPAATCLNTLAQWQSGSVWDGWRGMEYTGQAVLVLPCNMPEAMLVVGNGAVSSLPSVVDGHLVVDGQDLLELRDCGIETLELKLLSTTHILVVHFVLTAGKDTYEILAR